MNRAVIYSNRSGATGPEVLELREAAIPVPGAGEILVKVEAAGLNPVSLVAAGQGTDFAGFVVDAGSGPAPGADHDERRWHAGDAVLGHSVVGSLADYVAVPAHDVIAKPENLSWEVAGSLYSAAVPAWFAVQAVGPRPGRTVLVHDAAGAVGGIAAQLARLRGATVIGEADPESFDHLRQIGVVPVESGPGLRDRLAAVAPDGIDAELHPRDDGEIANRPSANRTILATVADLVARRQLVVPIAAIYPLSRLRDAYREFAAGEHDGAIVFSMDPVDYPHQKVHGLDVRESDALRDAPDRTAGPSAHEVLPPVFGHPHHDEHHHEHPDGRGER
jgi:NADPH:quinone reductase-like Zn-dependent oxidoreductase